MANVEVKINSQGLIKLFKDPVIQSACESVANAVVKNTGEKAW